MPRPRTRRSARTGFTLVELLVVILILAILIALLVPAIAGAVRSARDAQVNAEIANLNTAIASFKTQFTDNPPSRIILALDNIYSGKSNDNTPIATGDITYGQLRQRSLKYLRKFFPRFPWGAGGSYFPATITNNTVPGRLATQLNTDLILNGPECLVFFLGGMPQPSGGSIGMIGFSKNPLNPFDVVGTNRITPHYEFKSSQLVVMPTSTSGLPSYLDPLSGTTVSDQRPYAYFNSYGGNGYDPNDVNYPESDDTGTVTAIGQFFRTTFSGTNPIASPTPNPYTSNDTVPAQGESARFINPEGFQLFSSGRDRLWGLGGRWDEKSDNRLPLPNAAALNLPEAIRQREADNLANFSGGALD